MQGKQLFYQSQNSYTNECFSFLEHFETSSTYHQTMLYRG